MDTTKTKNNQKRFSLSTQEREKIQNIQSVLGILALQREGLNNSIMYEIAKVKSRCGITPKAPEGYERIIDFDPEKYELIVSDILISEKKETAVKEAN